MGFGAIFGLIVFGACNYEYANVSASEIAWWKRILTIIGIVLICGIIMLPGVLIDQDTIGNIYLTMILKTFLPTFLACLFLFSGVCERILVKINWLKINQDDKDVE